MKSLTLMVTNFQKLVSNGYYREALSLYSRNHAASILADAFTFPFIFKSCANLQCLQETLQLHTHVLKIGFLLERYTATALMDAYMNLRLPRDAVKMFVEIPQPTLPSFNAIISGFSKTGDFDVSFQMFKLLESQGIRPNSVSIASILPACRVVNHGSQFHCLSVKTGHELDGYVSTSLITMYLNCLDVESAVNAFQMVEQRKVVFYNAMISGLLQNQCFFTALNLFREMRLKPNLSTLLSILSVCSKLAALALGKQIHCYSLKSEAYSDVTFRTKLIDMYSKCGLLQWACRVFAQMKDKNMVTWNSMLSGLFSHGFVDCAVETFACLRSEGIAPDAGTWNIMISGFSRGGFIVESFEYFSKMQLERITHPGLKCMTSLLNVCSSISDLKHGQEIHCHAIRTGENYQDDIFQTALISMYMKCGDTLHACKVFNAIERRIEDPAIWNSMISGYGRNGKHELALEVFRMMLEEGVMPNSATFLSALSACSHGGMVQAGFKMIKMMIIDYGLRPTPEQFNCIVDLLARAGKLNEAWDLMREIPEPSLSMYASLLGACGCYCDAELGILVAERLSKLKPKSSSPLVALSNLYAEQGRWNDVEKLRMMLTRKGLKKLPGCSWIS
ncbi:Pentatricopeptide repeat-containing protein [Apostasia shenzhenica]|uniref:Pentatricopeptide repeat-containing protein n=1 Tax=Apostasia shenzhenica TaxID=1088818 RepID=A0A2I0B9M1_9ASPA|nr:Pentatricopeptide repeat-containing protein [Apostasia shenzhenica]